jgi:hypothetical protein
MPIKPRVLNMRRVTPAEQAHAVYVGRPSKWGNPFTHITGDHPNPNVTIVASRNEAIDRYEEWLMAHPELVVAAQRELRGKHLICYCAPSRCHADILLRIANA